MDVPTIQPNFHHLKESWTMYGQERCRTEESISNFLPNITATTSLTLWIVAHRLLLNLHRIHTAASIGEGGIISTLFSSTPIENAIDGNKILAVRTKGFLQKLARHSSRKRQTCTNDAAYLFNAKGASDAVDSAALLCSTRLDLSNIRFLWPLWNDCGPSSIFV